MSNKLVRINRKVMTAAMVKKLRPKERKLAAKSKWVKQRLHANNFSYSPGTRTQTGNPMHGLS